MLLIVGGLIFTSCNKKEVNPLLAKWDTPFQTAPFDKIEAEHYLPAFKEAIKIHNSEIDEIVKNTEDATFSNTIEALDYSGGKLKQVRRVFSAMNSAMSNVEMQEINKEVSPMLSAHSDDINLNQDLYKRVRDVYEKKEELGLNTEENKLLDKYYKNFVRGGVNLEEETKEEFRKINEELSLLMVQFGENVLNETNSFELVIENEDDLADLPENLITAASETAENKGYKGKWVFTIHKPSMIPFLQYSSKRDLRKKIYSAYFKKGDNNNNLDNKKLLSRIAMLRLKEQTYSATKHMLTMCLKNRCL